MQLALAFPEPPPPPQTTTIEIDVQARRTAYEILARILAQAVEAAKPMEVSDE
jgi:hypothetical protein